MLGAGIILNGGRASRMEGRDKARLKIDDKTSFDRLKDIFSENGQEIYVSVDAAFPGPDYEGFDIIRDDPTLLPANSKNPGAILAIVSCLEWAHRQKDVKYIITSPSDTPYLTDTYCKQLISAWRENGFSKSPVVAASNDRIHGLHALWPTTIYDQMRQHVVKDGERKLSALHRKLESIVVNFDAGHIDPFFNINTPDDLVTARDANDIS